MLGRDGRLLWWCAPDIDSTPLCWQLLDPEGGAASFDDLAFYDADEGPAGVSANTVLRGDDGPVEVRDALLPDADGVLLVRLLRRRPGTGEASEGTTTVRHRLRLGGFDAPAVTLAPDGRVATGKHMVGDGHVPVTVTAHRHRSSDDALISEVDLTGTAWQALVIAVNTPARGYGPRCARRAGSGP